MKSLLLLALLSTPAFAAPVATLQGDFDGDKLLDRATLTHQLRTGDPGYYRLEIKLGSGVKIESRQLVRVWRRVELSATPFGLSISSIEDESSHSIAYDYTIAIDGGKAELSIFNLEFSYPSMNGSCHLTPASGLALVDAKAIEIPAKRHPLPGASGPELEGICHQLMLKKANPYID
jgi:hypothetical protein